MKLQILTPFSDIIKYIRMHSNQWENLAENSFKFLHFFP